MSKRSSAKYNRTEVMCNKFTCMGIAFSERTSDLVLTIQNNSKKENNNLKVNQSNQNVVLGFDYNNVKFHHKIKEKN